MAAAKRWAVGLVGAALIGALLPTLFMAPVAVPIQPTDLSEMVRVDGGLVLVGDPPANHKVAPFYIDRFEVTEADWRRVARIDGPLPGPAVALEGRGDDFPIRGVTFDEAREFARRLFKRLPDNVEWEAASMGPGGAERPWGSGFLRDAANTHEIWERLGLHRRGVTRVGTFELGKSAAGAYDMIGNVWEWTRSSPEELLHTVRTPEMRRFLEDARLTGERYRIIRGGSFLTRLRGAGRLERYEAVGTASFDRGFRCVVSVREIRRQRRYIPEIRDLGYRDPLRYLLHVRPATSTLVSAGPSVLPYLRRVLGRSDDDMLRDRVRAIIEAIQGGR